MTRRRVLWRYEAVFLALVSIFALLLRLGYNVLSTGPAYEPVFDAREYNDIALSLAAGNGYRLADGAATAIRPPLFPLALAGVYRLFGPDHRAGLALQAFLGAGIVLATYWVACRVFGISAARIAAVIAATYPLLIFVGGSLLSEPLFVLLVTLAMGAGLRARERPGLGSDLLLGLLLGLAWLARPNGIMLLPFLLLWLVAAQGQPWRYRLGDALVVAMTAILVAMPWIARNYVAFGKLIPTSTMSGAVLLGSYNDVVLADTDLRGGWVSPCEIPGMGRTCALDEVSRDEVWRYLGTRFFWEHLSELPQMMWWRFVKFWHLYRFTHGFPANVGFYYYVVVAGLAAIGGWLTRGNWRRIGILLAVILCFMASALAFWGGFRMRAPAEPALIVLASGALVQIVPALSTATALRIRRILSLSKGRQSQN